jgi:hypothetical protein
MSILFYKMLIPIFVNFFWLIMFGSVSRRSYFYNTSLFDRHPTCNITLHVTFFLHINLLRSLVILVHNINMTLAFVVSRTTNNISNPSQKKEIMIFK